MSARPDMRQLMEQMLLLMDTLTVSSWSMKLALRVKLETLMLHAEKLTIARSLVMVEMDRSNLTLELASVKLLPRLTRFATRSAKNPLSLFEHSHLLDSSS